MTEENDTTDLDDEAKTTNIRERWEWTGTISAFLLLGSLVVITTLTTAGVFTIASVTQAWFALYSLAVLMAATWVFGKGVFKAVRDGWNS